MAARAIQSERFRGSPTRYNGDMTHRQIRQFCKLDEEGMNMLRTRWPRWVSRHALTTRSSAPRTPSPTSTPAPRSAPIISARGDRSFGVIMIHPIYRIVEFRIEGPYTLWVAFDDGTEQTIEFQSVLAGDGPKALGSPSPSGQRPRCTTHVKDPSGLVPLVNKVGWLRQASAKTTDPHVLVTWVKKIGGHAKLANLIHRPDEPDGVSMRTPFRW